MTRDEAMQLLGLSQQHGSEAVRGAFDAESSGLARRIASAPTEETPRRLRKPSHTPP